MPDLVRTADPDGRHGALLLHPWSERDIDELGEYWGRNRDHLTPTQPRRDPSFWTAEGQGRRVRDSAADVAAGRALGMVVREDGRIVADAGLGDVVAGAFRSAHLGYSVDGTRLRRGIASWAVNAIVEIAFAEFGLHRLQAATMVENVASQGVLVRCGFDRIGVAAGYLAIAGAWRDHVLWQRLNESMPVPG